MVQPSGIADANAVLTDVKAVSDGYPLRGSIMLAVPGTGERQPARGIPAPGEAWIDTRLADRLGARVGAKLAVGDATLTVTAIIAQEPEIAGLTFAPGPKLLLNLRDVPAHESAAARQSCDVAPAGRRTNAGKDRRLPCVARRPHQARAARRHGARPAARSAADARARREFLGLAALVAVLLAAVAVALAASRYLRRHLDAAAMFRCFGAPVATTLALFVMQFAVLGIIACALGVVGALIGQQALAACCRPRSSKRSPGRRPCRR